MFFKFIEDKKMMILLLTFVMGIVVSSLLLPGIVMISKKKRLFDEPNERSSHSKSVSRLGGLSFFPGLIFSVGMVLGIQIALGRDLHAFFHVGTLREQLFLLSGLMLVYLLGVTDDLVGVSFRIKFVYQLVAALLLIGGGVYVTHFYGVFGLNEMPPLLGAMMTVLLVVFVMNAVNMIDGVDGLASGLMAIPLIFFSIWFFLVKEYFYAMVSVGMLGTLVPFFIWNVFGSKRKLFMGDTGSLILGYLFAFLSTKFCMMNEDPNIYGIHGAPLVILALLFIPLMDTCRLFIERIRKKQSPFRADHNHIHHKFLEMGFSHRQTTAILVCIALIIASLNFGLLPLIGPNFMLLVDVVLWVVLMWGISWILKRKKRVTPVAP